jgi:tight adherence protein C
MSAVMLAASCAGAALALGAYAVWRLVAETGHAEAAYRDRPPGLFRLAWPLVNVFANAAAWTMTPAREAAALAKLRRAGQEYALTPQQLLGGKVLAAAVGALAGVVLAGDGALGPLLGGALGWVYPDLWLSDRTKRRNLAILKALPFFLDIVTLAVEAGLNLSGALQQAVDKCKPGPLIEEVNRVLRDVRAGRARTEALREMADRLDYAPMSSLVSALIQGETMGSSLGPILRAQSDQRRIERFQRAEKLAMEAPVKMLGPLILFIFPCTFIVLGFPIVMKFLSAGL